jgi:hypothetical protein
MMAAIKPRQCERTAEASGLLSTLERGSPLLYPAVHPALAAWARSTITSLIALFPR